MKVIRNMDVLPRREMDVEREMGERKYSVDARGRKVLTSGHIRGRVYGETGL